MKNFRSRYAGSPDVWVRFIRDWQKAKGVDVSLDAGFDVDGFLSGFPIDVPDSYRHFMAAVGALGCSDLLKVISVGLESSFSLLPPERIDCLGFRDELGGGVLKYPEEETLPMMLASDEYRNYSRSQDNLFPDKAFFGSWIVGEFCDVGGYAYLLLNPAVRSVDGEWGACYFDKSIPLKLNFQSFAHLVVYIYMHDVMGGLDLTWLGLEDDALGLSRLLFSDS